MLNLNSHIKPASRKKFGPLTMSEKACEEMGLLLICHGALTTCSPEQFGPIVAKTVESFLNTLYFEKNEWFRRQLVHTTNTIRFPSDLPKMGMQEPIFHLHKGYNGGYTVVSAIEVPLPEKYFEERVVEEAKVEIGIY